MTRYKAIKEVLEEMSSSDIVAVHNAYCDSCNYMGNHIYNMEEFDEIMGNMEPRKIAIACFYGDFCPAHDYFYYNGYGNLESFDYVGDNDPISIDDIAAYVDSEEDTLNSDELQEVIDEYEEDEEE